MHHSLENLTWQHGLDTAEHNGPNEQRAQVGDGAWDDLAAGEDVAELVPEQESDETSYSRYERRQGGDHPCRERGRPGVAGAQLIPYSHTAQVQSKPSDESSDQQILDTGKII